MSKIIKGYKALSPDMRAIMGDGMQYELGEKYALTGDVIPCVNGYHFCKKIEEINRYYHIHESRIFEVEASGTIETDDNVKFASESIKLVRELSQQEINDYFKVNYKKMIKSKSPYIREALAQQGLALDLLINDESYVVRIAVAKQGYRLDILVNDKISNVRRAVANQGYGLDILVKDENEYVREEVAKHGYGLDILMNDSNWHVKTIAKDKFAKLN